jgi:hypothetical protein
VHIFLLTLPFLIALGLSYSFSKRAGALSLEFAFWLISYQFIFIGLLGFGLIQSHIGCPMPLDECYIENYPTALDSWRVILETCLIGWMMSSAGMSLLNVLSIWRNRPTRVERMQE